MANQMNRVRAGSRPGLPRAIVCVGLAFASAAAYADCTPEWLPGSGLPGVGGTIAQNGSTLPTNVKASIMWDRDGAGPDDPVLVVGGGFSVAGATAVNNIAIWNGSSWEALGAGVGTGATANAVNALAVMPNGDLVAAGEFTTAGGSPASRIARWNGSAWSAFGAGANNTVNAMAVTATGDLIVGGLFTSIDGMTVNRIARWNDTTSMFSAFVATNGSQAVGLSNPGVNALLALPDGNLLVGGGFLHAGGGTGIHRLGIWNTATSEWQFIAPGVNGPGGNIFSLLRTPGNEIIVGGSFSNINSVSATNIARWNGAEWLPLEPGLGSTVRSLARATDGTIFAGGDFANAGSESVNRLAAWDGSAWSSIWSDTSNRNVYTLCFDNEGDLVVGGNFTTVNDASVSGLAGWNGESWETYTEGGETSGFVTTLTTTADGQVLAGGAFTQIEGTPAARVAVLDNGTWSALGNGLDTSTTPTQNVAAVLKLPNGAIVAGGEFQTLDNGATVSVGLAYWNGSGWTPFPGADVQTGRQIMSMAIMPNGDLAVGGNFLSIGGVTANRVARWDGTNWHAMGDGIDNFVYALAVHDGELVAGGNFSTINGGTATAHGVARWDGSAWYSFVPDIGISATVRSFAVLPNGDLVIGGGYISAGLNPVNRLARWDGTDWYPLGSGLGTSNTNFVNALAVLDNGDLIAAGEFTAASGVSPAPVRLARWNGSAWSAFGSGANGTVYALTIDDDGTLLAGGNFSIVDGKVSNAIARWACAEATGACCVGAVCSITTQAACVGTYNGDGTLCENINCCPADFNGVNGVTVQDIFDFLTAWLAGSPSADFNAVNGVTVQDIFDFLTAWLAGC